MGRYGAVVEWSLEGGDFPAGRYSRAHQWTFDGGVSVPASSSPTIVPLPHSREDAVDPEEAFVAALSSCHMLFFLSLAAAEGIVVDRYRDAASGVLARSDDGALRMTRVTLRPEASYRPGHEPTPEQLTRLHHEAHTQCFIANSVTSEVVTEIVS